MIDRSYLCGGASGRNGGGVRAQWSSEANVRLMLESIRMCREFAAKMKINVWLRQGGYLFLARTPALRAKLEKSVALQNDCGLSTRMLSPREARRIVPELDVEGVQAASYNPDDGVVFPWPFVWGYAQAARKLGVEVIDWHEVVGFETRGARIEGVRVRRSGPPGAVPPATACYRRSRPTASSTPPAPGRRRSRGCSASSSRTARTATRFCSSEPLKPWLKPLVADLSDGLYFSQSTRGEIVGGIGNEYVPPGLDQESSHAFLGRYARSLVRACPVLGGVKVLRQWAGCYDLTPDANPIVGAVDGVDELLPGERLHGARLHDGARRRQAHRGRHRGGRGAGVRSMEPAEVQGRKAPRRGNDHRVKIRHAKSSQGDSMPVTARAVALSFLTVLSACGGAFGPAPQSAARAGNTWFEVTTRRFVLHTDLGEDAARAAARDFETAYEYLEQVGFPGYEGLTQRMDVVLFAGAGEFHHFWPGDMSGVYFDRAPQDLERAPTMVLYGGLDGDARIVFLHELTHRFIARAYGWAPAWMNEGLADYFSTMRDRIGAGRSRRGPSGTAPRSKPRPHGSRARAGGPRGVLWPVDRRGRGRGSPRAVLRRRLRARAPLSQRPR